MITQSEALGEDMAKDLDAWLEKWRQNFLADGQSPVAAEYQACNVIRSGLLALLLTIYKTSATGREVANAEVAKFIRDFASLTREG